MEEKENKKVKLKTGDAPEKISYERLKQLFDESRQQIGQMEAYIEQLHTRISQMSDVIESKRLDYLFKVLENSIIIKDAEFITRTVDEIKAALFAPEQPEQVKA